MGRYSRDSLAGVLENGLADAVKSEGTRAFGLAGLWIHPEHRRRGLAGRLVQCGLEWVKEYPLGEDGKCLVVDVYSENEAAKAVYTKMGFREKHVYTEEGTDRLIT